MSKELQILGVLDQMASVGLEQAKALKELKLEMAKATIVINQQDDRLEELERQVSTLSVDNWPTVGQ